MPDPHEKLRLQLARRLAIHPGSYEAEALTILIERGFTIMNPNRTIRAQR